MIQVAALIHVGSIKDEALIKDTRRVSILQRMSTFIRELLGRRQFARPLDASNYLIVYTRRATPPDTEREVAQDELRLSHPITR